MRQKKKKVISRKQRFRIEKVRGKKYFTHRIRGKIFARVPYDKKVGRKGYLKIVSNTGSIRKGEEVHHFKKVSEVRYEAPKTGKVPVNIRKKRVMVNATTKYEGRVFTINGRHKVWENIESARASALTNLLGHISYAKASVSDAKLGQQLLDEQKSKSEIEYNVIHYKSRG